MAHPPARSNTRRAGRPVMPRLALRPTNAMLGVAAGSDAVDPRMRCARWDSAGRGEHRLPKGNATWPPRTPPSTPCRRPNVTT